jgi:hypothetical protein
VQLFDFRSVCGSEAVAQAAGRLDAVFDIALQRALEFGAVRIIEKIRPQVRGADRVGLRHDQILALDEPRTRGRETETQQQAEQAENRALHGADLRAGAGVRVGGRAPAESESRLERDQEQQKNADGD